MGVYMQIIIFGKESNELKRNIFHVNYIVCIRERKKRQKIHLFLNYYYKGGLFYV